MRTSLIIMALLASFASVVFGDTSRSFQVSVRSDLSQVVVLSFGAPPDTFSMEDGIARFKGTSPEEVGFLGLMTHEAIEGFVKDTGVSVLRQRPQNGKGFQPSNTAGMYVVERTACTLQALPVKFSFLSVGAEWHTGEVFISQKAEDWSPWPTSE